MTSEATAAYLRRVRLPEGLAPGLENLVRIHRAHLDAVPYESLSTMLGRPPSADPAASLARIGEVGRAGYCFHQNGALELVLRELGYAVTRWHAAVYSSEDGRSSTALNHLALEVDGLPTEGNPGGRWWVDVGLGDCLRDPLPLVPGLYTQGAFTYELTDVRADGWSFRHDPAGSFLGLEVTDRPIDQAAVEEAHARLTTPPTGDFTRLTVVQKRGDQVADTVRGCLRTTVEGADRHEAELTTYDAWRGAVESLGLSLAGLDEHELRTLYAAQWAKHQAWDAAGRP